MNDIYKMWSIPFIQSLQAAGVEQIVISPGSRSTSLALAALANKELSCTTVVDERSAAFFALGQIRITGKPSAIVCTSGSAGAHYFPAVVEAFHSSLPLIIVTADRPWELQQCGANQTVQQHQIFGSYANYFELGEPTENQAAQLAACRIPCQAVFTAMGPTKGPVHINARFRKPLEPPTWPIPNSAPPPAPTRAIPPRHMVSDVGVQQLASLCNTHSKGIIICGPGPLTDDAAQRKKSILEFARITGFPIFSEASSCVNCAPEILKNSSTLFQTDAVHTHLPKLIIEIHRPLTTSSYEKFVSQNPQLKRAVLSDDAYVDPSSTADLVLVGEIADALERTTTLLHCEPNPHWSQRLKRMDQNVSAALESFLKKTPFCEGNAIASISKSLSEDTILCLGNSMIIRDMDMFTPQMPCATVLHQRGASGIDGLISGAAGTASCCDRPVVLLIGDLSALHDLGGFALLKNGSSPLVVVIINNDGGQIFNQLPIANDNGLREDLHRAFVIPGTPSFEGVCKMFQISYTLAEDTTTLETALANAIATPGATVIEAKVKPNLDFRKEFIQSVESFPSAKRNE